MHKNTSAVKWKEWDQHDLSHTTVIGENNLALWLENLNGIYYLGEI